MLIFLFLLSQNTLLFEEEFSFGFEKGEDHYLWVHPQSMLYANQKGQMLLTDPTEDRVLLFDVNGDLLKEIGGKGNGPGEFVGLFSMRPNPGGATAISLDQIIPTTHEFNADYQFVSRKSAQGPPFILIHAELSPNGKTFAAYYLTIDRDAGVNRFNTGLFSHDFKLLHQIDSQSGMISDPSQLRNRNYWVDRLSQNIERYFQKRIHFSFSPQGDLFFSGNRKIEVYRVVQGKPSSYFQHDLPSEPLGDQEKEAILDITLEEVRSDRDLMEIITPAVVREATEKAEIPGTKDHVYGIIPINDRDVLVITKVEHTSGEQTATLFRDGQKLTSQTLKNQAFTRLTHAGYVPSMTIQGDKAYALLKTEDGELRAVRYKIHLPN